MARGGRSLWRSLRLIPAAPRLHASTADASPDGLLCGAQYQIDGHVRRGVSTLDHDAREPAEDDFQGADVIDASARPVRVRHPKRHALD